MASDPDAEYDDVYQLDATSMSPMVTWGITPGQGIGVDENMPRLTEVDETEVEITQKAYEHMGFDEGQKIEGQKIDVAFIGSCTNSRIEDFRVAANYVKGKQKAPNINAWLVPGSQLVVKQIQEEGLDKIFEAAGFKLRQPGCSACLAMNDDKIPAGEYCVSTSNRNFEGRQGQGSRTILASPLVAAATAVEGRIIDSITER